MRRGTSCRFEVRVTPRSSRSRVQWIGDKLQAWVTAPPAEGQANEALIKLLAHELKMAPSAISIVRGGHGREKVVEIVGLQLEQAIQRLLD